MVMMMMILVFSPFLRCTICSHSVIHSVILELFQESVLCLKNRSIQADEKQGYNSCAWALVCCVSETWVANFSLCGANMKKELLLGFRIYY